MPTAILEHTTRIREQKLGMDMGEVDLVSVVRSALDMTALSASARGIPATAMRPFAPIAMASMTF